MLAAPLFYAQAEEASAPAAEAPQVKQEANSTAVEPAAPAAETAPAVEDKAPAASITEPAVKVDEVKTDEVKSAPVAKEAALVKEAEKVSAVAVKEETKADPEVKTSPLPAITFSLNSEEQRRAYASGVTLARYLQENMAHQRKLHITLDPNIVLAGIVDAFANDVKMDEDTVRQTMAVFDEQVNLLNKAKAEQEAQREREMGQAFWSAFEQQDGVKKSRTGLLYRVDQKSSGAAIGDRDIVEVELTGSLPNGTVFEKTAQPIRVKVEDIIPALRSAIKLTGRGGEARIVIPPEQGYGAKGALPADSSLCYTDFRYKGFEGYCGKR